MTDLAAVEVTANSIRRRDAVLVGGTTLRVADVRRLRTGVRLRFATGETFTMRHGTAFYVLRPTDERGSA